MKSPLDRRHPGVDAGCSGRACGHGDDPVEGLGAGLIARAVGRRRPSRRRYLCRMALRNLPIGIEDFPRLRQEGPRRRGDSHRHAWFEFKPNVTADPALARTDDRGNAAAWQTDGRMVGEGGCGVRSPDAPLGAVADPGRWRRNSIQGFLFR